MRRNAVTATCKLTLAALTGAVLGLAGTAHAQQSSIFDDLLEKLRDKGVLTQEEYDALKAARDEERSKQRAERRQQALKEAQAAEKEEKAKAEAPSNLSGRFRNGFTWESGDKANSITLSGRIQADFRTFEDDIAANTFDVRRAYVGVQGKLFNDWTFDVTADLAQSSSSSPSSLDVAWINWGAYQSVQLRAGQFKMPMSVEELTSSRFIDFQERSLVNQFIPAKERGAMLHGTPFTGLFYGVALSNGQGKNNNEVSTTIDDFDFIARVGVNAAEWLERKNMVIHVAGAYSKGDLATSTTGAGTGNLLTARTEARGVTFFQVPALTGNSVERERQLAELSLAWGPVKLQSEYLNVNFSGTSAPAGVGYDRNLDVYYAEALWMITGEDYASAYRNGAYGRIVPRTNFSLKDGTWGAFEVGLRYSDLNAGDFVGSNPAGTGGLSNNFTNKASAYTVGLKWIMNPNVRAYLNYVKTDFDTPITVTPSGRSARQYDDEQAITLRLGLDF
jgi:phosphate-selective porin OprO/OprP